MTSGEESLHVAHRSFSQIFCCRGLEWVGFFATLSTLSTQALFSLDFFCVAALSASDAALPVCDALPFCVAEPPACVAEPFSCDADFCVDSSVNSGGASLTSRASLDFLAILIRRELPREKDTSMPMARRLEARRRRVLERVRGVFGHVLALRSLSVMSVLRAVSNALAVPSHGCPSISCLTAAATGDAS